MVVCGTLLWESAKEVSQMIARTWKCTDPQWAAADEAVNFNAFEILRTPQGLLLSQNSYTKDLLARYADLEGYEEVPAPVQLSESDFELEGTVLYFKHAVAGDQQEPPRRLSTEGVTC